jgi:hypothetical protein
MDSMDSLEKEALTYQREVLDVFQMKALIINKIDEI